MGFSENRRRSTYRLMATARLPLSRQTCLRYSTHLTHTSTGPLSHHSPSEVNRHGIVEGNEVGVSLPELFRSMRLRSLDGTASGFMIL